MNKQSETKPSLQAEANKLNPAKDELNEKDLNKVSGGHVGGPGPGGTALKDPGQEQPGNEMGIIWNGPHH